MRNVRYLNGDGKWNLYCFMAYPRLFLRLDRGPRVARPPLSPVSDRDAAGDRRAHLRAPEPGSPDAHPAPGGRPRAQRKPGHSPAPGGARPVQEARLSAGQRRVRRTELRPRPPAYRMPFGLGSPVLSGGRRRNHDGKGADARGASLWPDRQAARRPQVAGRRRAERGRRLPRGYRSLGTGAGLLRPATRLSAPASTPGEAGAGPGGALRPCHRGSPAGAELREFRER